MRIDVDENLSLRLVHPEGAAEATRVIQRDLARIADWLPWATAGYDDAAGEAFVERAVAAHAAGEQLPLWVVERGRIVGGVGFNRIEVGTDGTGERRAMGTIGYWLAADASGRGVMTRSVGRLVEHGFTELGMERVEIRTEPQNHGSVGVAERAGFTHEGTLRRLLERDGRWRDHRVYAKLRRIASPA